MVDFAVAMLTLGAIVGLGVVGARLDEPRRRQRDARTAAAVYAVVNRRPEPPAPSLAGETGAPRQPRPAPIDRSPCTLDCWRTWLRGPCGPHWLPFQGHIATRHPRLWQAVDVRYLDGIGQCCAAPWQRSWRLGWGEYGTPGWRAFGPHYAHDASGALVWEDD